MNIQSISAINYPASGSNIKSGNNMQSKRDFSKTLSKPAEMYRYQQVTFERKKQFSKEDLNILAEAISASGIKPEEISSVKTALRDFFTKNKINRFSEVNKKLDEDDIIYAISDLDETLQKKYNIPESNASVLIMKLMEHFE